MIGQSGLTQGLAYVSGTLPIDASLASAGRRTAEGDRMQHFSHHHDEVTASAVAGDVPSKPAASGFTALTSRYAIVDRLEQAVIVVLWAAF